jgi:hypothetical protein
MKKLLIALSFFSVLLACRTNEKSSSFEKIIYNTSHCFGSCPVYHLEIDNQRDIKLFAEVVYKKGLPLVSQEDTTKMGYFKGTANDTTFSKLNKAILEIGIDTLTFDNTTCCDGSLKTIIVYYKGKRKYLKSMFPPEKADKLIEALDEICRTSNLERTDKKFKLEN